MSSTDIINDLAVPAGLFITAFLSWALKEGAIYLRERTKTLRGARVADYAGRIAGEIHDKIAMLPPGSDLAAVKEIAIETGVADLKERTGATIIALGGASDKTLTGIVRGEFGKLAAASPPPVLVPVPTDIALSTTGTIPADAFATSKGKIP